MIAVSLLPMSPVRTSPFWKSSAPRPCISVITMESLQSSACVIELPVNAPGTCVPHMVSLGVVNIPFEGLR